MIFGTKHWYLTPPRFAGMSGTSGPEWAMGAEEAKGRLPRRLPMRCTQHAGDLLILPAMWGHATRNEGFSLGLGYLFTDHFYRNRTVHGMRYRADRSPPFLDQGSFQFHGMDASTRQHAQHSVS